MTDKDGRAEAHAAAAAPAAGGQPRRLATPEKNPRMYFFVQIVDALGYSFKELERKTGFTQQLISYWMSHDDCKVSNLIDIMDGIGVELRYEFRPDPGRDTVSLSAEGYDLSMRRLRDMARRGDSLRVSAERYSLSVDGIEGMARKGPAPNDAVEQFMESSKYLRPLTEFIRSEGCSFKDFAGRIDYKYMNLYMMFLRDDMKVSVLYEIAQRTGTRLCWSASPKKGEDGGGGGA